MSRVVAHCLSSLALLVSVFSTPAWAEDTKADRQRDASQMVTHALDHEADGKNADRNELLQWALEKSPDFAPALWHSGFVRLDGKWTKADDVPQLAARNKDLAAYFRERDSFPQTPQGQLQLAGWCAQRKLVEQERAHLTKVLDLQPNNEQARKRLRFVQIGGVWRSESEIRAAAAQAESTAASIKKWSPRLKQIQRALEQTGGHSMPAATRLAAIQDMDAIPAVEQLLATVNEGSAQLVIGWLSKMKSPEASLALARLAVTSRWASTRESAAEKLKPRSEDEYVPALLSCLSSPILSRTELYQARDGRLVYNHAFYREAQDHKELATYQTAFERGWRRPASTEVVAQVDGPTQRSPAGLRRFTRTTNTRTTQASEPNAAKAVAAAQQEAAAHENQRDAANGLIEEQNRLVCEALATATGKDLGSSPESWWEWWRDHNESETFTEKPLQESRRTYRVAVDDTPGYYNDRIGTETVYVPPPMPAHSCLAAGTPIWTSTGTAYVERIKVGDLVLSQNPETGELAYKPVVGTTINKGAKLFRLRVGGDEIKSTGGHAFWVDRSGWVRARELETGARMHSISGGKVLEYAQATETVAPVYNLIVADFHTYFVGQERVLSHDITNRTPVSPTTVGLQVK